MKERLRDTCEGENTWLRVDMVGGVEGGRGCLRGWLWGGRGEIGRKSVGVLRGVVVYPKRCCPLIHCMEYLFH